MGIIAWIIFGLIAGAIAKLIMPGNDGGGFILTCVLGVVGAVVGGWLATMFGFGGNISGFDLHSFSGRCRGCHCGAGHIQVTATSIN
ncbi:transglycosylase [Enterobacter asburiae]|uniref:Transglycosylase n=2 Tax=Enterobacter asburiae TaxID=61645 RepID=A0A376FEE5_ENTAS|nr:transglycosylase [Enterobacter asburiae]